MLVTDIILNITSQEHWIFTSLHISSRLFELLSKEVRVKKHSGIPLSILFLKILPNDLKCVHIHAVSHTVQRMFISSNFARFDKQEVNTKNTTHVEHVLDMFVLNCPVYHLP